MKAYFFGILVLLNLISVNALADERITVGEASLAFLLPEGWGKSPINDKPASATMDSSNPLFRAWKHKVIMDSSGRPIEPGMNVVVFNVPPDTNISLMSSALMHKRGWPFKQFLTTANDGLSLSNSHGYLTEFAAAPNVQMRLFVIHAINHGKFVEVTLSSTQDTFDQVLPEFKSIISSLRVDKTRPPIDMKTINELLPKGITIASVAKVPFGVKLGICGWNPATLMKYLLSLEESVGLYQLTNVTGLHSTTPVGQPRSLMQFDVILYGNTDNLADTSTTNSCS